MANSIADIEDGTGTVARVSGEHGGGDGEIRATSPGANTHFADRETPLFRHLLVPMQLISQIFNQVKHKRVSICTIFHDYHNN